ncbi:hypothetical protein [Streptomyces sp. NPDC004726]
MNHDAPLSPVPLAHISSDVQRRVLCAAQLRAHGVTAALTTARCKPGGPWQALLPGVYVLHSGPVTGEERLHGALLYARRPRVPAQGGKAEPYGKAMITGLAALALRGFATVPALPALERIDVLVPRTRRLRSTGYARIVRAHAMPGAEEITGLPVAPVARALADAVAESDDPDTVRSLLTEAVRGGHCEPAAVVAELNRARLLDRPQVVDAADSLLAEGRSLAEGLLYEMVFLHGLPDPFWNVDLRLPGGPRLGTVDAYWPEQAVALELDTLPGDLAGERPRPRPDQDERWAERARKRERLERFGITVVHLTPRKLRESPEQQAAVVRTALIAAADREPAAYLAVLPR